MFRLLKLRSRDRTRDSCNVKNGVLELLLAYFNVFITINVLIIHRYSDILYFFVKIFFVYFFLLQVKHTEKKQKLHNK